MTSTKEGILKEIYKPSRKKFQRRKVIIKDIHETLGIDLAVMIPHAKKNKNMQYILCAIDHFSKFAYAEPIKDKTGPEVAKAMKKILSRCPETPKFIQSDQGTEFFNTHFNKLMKDKKITHYNTYTCMKSAICERFIRTLKTKLYFQFDLRGSYNWIDILQDVVNQYNNTKHRTIKMAPAQVTRENAKAIFDSVYAKHVDKTNPTKAKFKIGDIVRMSKQKQIFEKGYLANWTTELFKIDKVVHSIPRTYLLKDFKGEEIKGVFYEQELQKTRFPGKYLIAKTLQKKNGREKVRWLGFPPSEDSWINVTDEV